MSSSGLFLVIMDAGDEKFPRQWLGRAGVTVVPVLLRQGWEGKALVGRGVWRAGSEQRRGWPCFPAHIHGEINSMGMRHSSTHTHWENQAPWGAGRAAGS